MPAIPCLRENVYRRSSPMATRVELLVFHETIAALGIPVSCSCSAHSSGAGFRIVFPPSLLFFFFLLNSKKITYGTSRTTRPLRVSETGKQSAEPRPQINARFRCAIFTIKAPARGENPGEKKQQQRNTKTRNERSIKRANKSSNGRDLAAKRKADRFIISGLFFFNVFLFHFFAVRTDVNRAS